jgi:uncharacterized protein (DUF1778 family)
MEIITVRLGDSQLELIKAEAALDGISLSQFMRDAAFARAVMQNARRNGRLTALLENITAFTEEAGNDALAGQLLALLDDFDDDALP